jgi:hypothetical protein
MSYLSIFTLYSLGCSHPCSSHIFWSLEAAPTLSDLDDDLIQNLIDKDVSNEEQSYKLK